jgi:hypothetical protein
VLVAANVIRLSGLIIALCGLLVTRLPPIASAQNALPKQALGEYHPYDPPRANWGPGFVFSGDVRGGRISNVKEVCPNLYADTEAPQDTPIAFADYNASEGLSFAASLRLLKGLFGLNFDIDQIARERTVDVKWQNVREHSYTAMDQWLESGQPRPIAARCRLAIDDIKAKNQFADRIFVIFRAAAADSVVYEFDAAANGAGSASAQLWRDAQASAKVTADFKNGTKLEIKQRLFVGYISPMKLVDWLPTGQASGEITGVKGEKTDFIIDPE